MVFTEPYDFIEAILFGHIAGAKVYLGCGDGVIVCVSINGKIYVE